MFQRKVNITRIKNGRESEEIDTVLIEVPIDIILNSEPLVNIICLPHDLKPMAIGFLFSIGIINSVDDIKEITINDLEGKIDIKLNNSIESVSKNLNLNPVSRVIDTTCGIPSPWRNIMKNSLDHSKADLFSKMDIKLNPDIIHRSIIRMQKETKLFRETGGCHGAAIFDFKGNLKSVKEDIGRHNAIDKVIGDLLLQKEQFDNKFLTSTGRLTGDSVLKAIRAKIPIVASLSAAIESGIRLAFGYGITLIGFARGNRMNIYSHPNRLLI
jgi:FdhD protein